MMSRILVSLLTFFLLSAATLAQSPPERPYEPLQWSQADSVPLPVLWYATMYDSISVPRGYDGYNSLQVVFGSRTHQLVVDDLLISNVDRAGSETMGAYIEARSLTSGDLVWRQILDTAQVGVPFTRISMREYEGDLQVLWVYQTDERRNLDLFPFGIVGDSCKVVTATYDLSTGEEIGRAFLPDSLAFSTFHNIAIAGFVSSHYFWEGDQVRYYEYDKFVPHQVIAADLSVSGELLALDTLSHGDRPFAFEMLPWGDGNYLVYEYTPDSVYIAVVDRAWERQGPLVHLPLRSVIDSRAFLYALQDGSVLVEEFFVDDRSIHLYDSTLRYQWTDSIPDDDSRFAVYFAYKEEVYALTSTGLVTDGGLELYRFGESGIDLLYEWSILDDRSFVPLYAVREGDILYVQGNETAVSRSMPNRRDPNANAISTIAIDLSQLNLVTSSDEVHYEQGEMQVAPNPVAGGNVRVTLETADAVTLYTIDGQLVLRNSEPTEHHQLSVAGLANGVYVLRTDGGLTQRVIVQR